MKHFKMRPSRQQLIAGLAMEDNDTLPIVSTAEPEGALPEPVAPDEAELPEIDPETSEIEDVAAAQAEDVAEVGVAVQSAQTIDEAVATLESILADRVPTSQELYLVGLASNQALPSLGLESVMPTELAASEEDRRFQAEQLKLQLESVSERIWSAIKAGMAKIVAGYDKAIKALKWAFSSATTKLTKFRAELVAFEGEPKVVTAKVNGAFAHFTGLGYNLDPAAVIKQVEKANEYVYRELFNQVALFAAEGKPEPSVSDDPFDTLPGEPRFRFNAQGAALVMNPSRARDATVDCTKKDFLIAWIDALLEESTYFLRNYENFRSTAEKIYDAIRTATADGEESEIERMADAAAKLMFARSHSCIAVMEEWVYYVVNIMDYNVRTLMAIRKLAFA